MTPESVLKQITNISKAHAYDILVEQVQELKAENNRLRNQLSWVPVNGSLPEEGKRIEMIVEFENVKTIGGAVLPRSEAIFNGAYHNVLGWYKKAGREEAHVAEKIQSGKVIKWRYL